MNPAQKLKAVSVLPASTPLETLRLLCGCVQGLVKSGSTELPRVTIFMSGATFTGFVAGVRDDGDASYILFVEHDDARAQSINIVYLPAWSIVAVKVHEADQYLHLLSGGKVEAQKAKMSIATLRNKIGDEVSRLRAAIQADVRLEVSWETLSQDDLSLLGLYELIDNFMNALQETLTDEFKRITFKHLFNVIRFQNHEEPEIQEEEKTIIVRACLKDREPGRFNREEFLSALETLLSES